MADQTHSGPEDGRPGTSEEMLGLTQIGDDPHVSPEVDAFISRTLSNLDQPPMPDEVAKRIFSALSAESAVRAAQTETTGTPADELARRRRRGRWFVAASGVAAACALGIVVGSTVLSDPGAPASQIQASAIPMSASGMHYEEQNLRSQVSEQISTWRSMATATASQLAPTEPVATPDVTTTDNPSRVTVPGAAALAAARASITECVKNVSAGTPMHVDIGLYRAPAQPVEQQVAVVAVPAAAERMVDVYVVGLGCKGSDTQLRAHVRIPDPG